MSIENSSLAEALVTLRNVSSRQEFDGWTRGPLQTVLPHGAYICGIGKIQQGAGIPFELLSNNFPAKYLRFISFGNDGYRSLTIQRWLESGQPQLFDPARDGSGADKVWLEIFRDSGLRNIAAHGLMDIDRGHASYFSFHQIPPPLSERHKQVLELMVPSLHTILLKIIAPLIAAPNCTEAQSPLTPREVEIMSWVCQGKTNGEIAQILAVSHKTIKNHIQNVLTKLDVHTRAQAVSVAMKQKLLD